MNRSLPLLAWAVLSTLAAAADQAQVHTAPDSSPFRGRLLLVRYDMPRGLSDGYAPTRQIAQRKGAPDGVDWPAFSLNSAPLWQDKGEAVVPLALRKGFEAESFFPLPSDDVIEPGKHRLRAVEWKQQRKYLYTADRTARTAPASEALEGTYELWTFPVIIRGDGGPVVRNVELKAGGKVIYHQEGPWRSLTLLLPANETGKQYELVVAGRGPVHFDAGLQAIKLGDPHDQVITGQIALPGDGPPISIHMGARSEEFPNPKEWAADLSALKTPRKNKTGGDHPTGPGRFVGIEVPASPFSIYGAALPHGMSGGFFHKGMKAEEYASVVAGHGYDTVFDPISGTLLPPEDPESIERRGAALAKRNVRLGLQYDQSWDRPSLQHPNLALLSHTLPDWHAPLYRSLSLAAQRFAKLPNFAGIQIGADNAGFTSAWPILPPRPDRPWGEAMLAYNGGGIPKVPRGPSLGAPELPYEQPVATEAEFLRFAERYENVFRQYGYFAEAVREVDPKLVFTTASFGSSPGTGSRGGWPWASQPGRIIFEGLGTQQAYDWNSSHAAKPLHEIALLDRLRSYHPRLRTWALVDNFRLLYGRSSWQRACALALTRGIQGLGTNFIATTAPETDGSDAAAGQKEMNAWMRRYGAVFAHTEPEAAIGIFYSQLQALQRPVLTAEKASSEQLLAGSHEGKVTEALFLCHAAGWPARVITAQELIRGPLPTSMKAILLTGLRPADASWSWFSGLEPALKQFVERGGRILLDHQSVCPVPAVETGLEIAAYISQSNMDATSLLLQRNAGNITRLRSAMEGLPTPLARSEDPTIWAIPATCGDTYYVTVVNQSVAEGADAGEMLRAADPKATKPEPWKTKANASVYVKPATAHLQWVTKRPIYDVRLGRKLSQEEASAVDLNKDSFAWLALPPAEVLKPEVSFAPGGAGFFEARPTMTNGTAMAGIPIEIKVATELGSAVIYGASGQASRLPFNQWLDHGQATVTVTELLTGLSTTATLESTGPVVQPADSQKVHLRNIPALTKFRNRKKNPVTIALTAEQQQDAEFTGEARKLADHYRSQGRTVSPIEAAGPGGVVESLQILRSPHRYPQWRTTPVDLVLFGTPANNVLVLDQARGQLFPDNIPSEVQAGMAEVIYVRSAFVGECDVVNILTKDAAGAAAAVKALCALDASPARRTAATPVAKAKAPTTPAAPANPAARAEPAR